MKNYPACRLLSPTQLSMSSADLGGGGGGGGQVFIWVSIGNKQLDPPGKCWTHSGTLKSDRFFCLTDLDPPLMKITGSVHVCTEFRSDLFPFRSYVLDALTKNMG